MSGSWTPIDTISARSSKERCGSSTLLMGSMTTTSTRHFCPGQIIDYVWRADNLAKVQANLTSRNIVTASFLSNYYHDKYDGLGFLFRSQPLRPRLKLPIWGPQRSVLFPRRNTAGNRIRRRPVRHDPDAKGNLRSTFLFSRGQLLPARGRARPPGARYFESLPAVPSVAWTARH